MNVQEIASRVEAIREEEEMGATGLARRALELLGEMATDPALPNDSFADLFLDTARGLGIARPSVASLSNGVAAVLAAWLEAGGAHNVGAARAAAADEARRWIARQDSSLSVIADHAAEVVTGIVITLGYSSTVLHALKECWARGVISGVTVAESRPRCEGWKTAAALAARGIPTTLITDAEVGIFAPEAGAALVGAGTIRPNGALVNGTGTLLLALAARRCRVPFYALAETHKIAPWEERGKRLPPEERDSRAILPEPIPGVVARNVAFDVTPTRYLTGYITERGLLDRNDVVALSKEVPGALMLGLQSPGPGS
ncbi:MAG: translation initiation factor eIF-2B [Sphingomonadaceae bacterium]